jgi:hypothetical protein
LGAVLAAGFGLAHARQFPGGEADKRIDVPPALAFLPPDAGTYVHTRVHDLLGSDVGLAMRDATPDDVRAFHRGFQYFFSIDAEKVETLTVAYTNIVSTLEIFSPRLFGLMEAPLKQEPKAEKANSNIDKVDKDAAPEPKKDSPLPPPRNAPEAENLAAEDETDSPLTIVTVYKPADLAACHKFIAKSATPHEHKGKTYYLLKKDKSIGCFFVDDVTVVRGPASWIRAGIERMAVLEPRARLQALLANQAKHVWLDARRVTEQGSQWDEIPSMAPLKEARGKQVAFTFGPTTQIEARVAFSTEAAAQAAIPAFFDYLVLFRVLEMGRVQASLERLLDEQLAGGQPEKLAKFLLILERISEAYRSGKLRQEGSALTFEVKAEIDVAAIAENVGPFVTLRTGDNVAQTARAITKTKNNLHRIGIALQGFNGTFGKLPPWAICDKDGNPLLSWRVLLLPFLGEGELFAQFKLDEGWDGLHNIKLVDKLPAVFRTPLGKFQPGHTFYQGFVGKGAGWELMPDSKQRLGAVGLSLTDFKDGPANTIAVVDAVESVPWTKPADIPFDAAEPLPQAGGLFKVGTYVLLFDGSVRLVRRSVSPETWRAAITRAGGEPLPADWNASSTKGK